MDIEFRTEFAKIDKLVLLDANIQAVYLYDIQGILEFEYHRYDIIIDITEYTYQGISFQQQTKVDILIQYFLLRRPPPRPH